MQWTFLRNLGIVALLMARLTATAITAQKGGSPLVALTAYDYPTAKIIDPHTDIVLVGDSVGMVVQGKENTLSVTLDEMIYHTACVHRGLKHAHLVADMPFLSYQPDVATAIRSAGRLIAEGGAQSVKLEGGTTMAPTITRLVDIGIPVMAHVGLTPQSVHKMGGFHIQGRSCKERASILEDALSVEDAGSYAIVLEGIPAELALEITKRLSIPTIGIGAGKNCDGQVLVFQDLIGLNPDFKPRFVKRYAELHQTIADAVSLYAREVKNREFPAQEHTFYADTELSGDRPSDAPSLEV